MFNFSRLKLNWKQLKDILLMKEVYYHLTEKFKILLTRFSLKIPLLLLHGKAIIRSQNSGNRLFFTWLLFKFMDVKIGASTKHDFTRFLVFFKKSWKIQNFMLLRIYVKLVLGIPESQNLPFTLEAQNFDFYEFLYKWRLKFTKLTILKTTNIAKTAVLEFPDWF